MNVYVSIFLIIYRSFFLRAWALNNNTKDKFSWNNGFVIRISYKHLESRRCIHDIYLNMNFDTCPTKSYIHAPFDKSNFINISYKSGRIVCFVGIIKVIERILVERTRGFQLTLEIKLSPKWLCNRFVQKKCSMNIVNKFFFYINFHNLKAFFWRSTIHN